MQLMEKLLTVKEVADRLQLSVETVKKMLRSGEIPGRKYGRQWRVSPSELMQSQEDKRNQQHQDKQVD